MCNLVFEEETSTFVISVNRLSCEKTKVLLSGKAPIPFQACCMSSVTVLDIVVEEMVPWSTM